MHATHQFFLTRRSLYLMVLSARGGEHESRLHKWLKLIQSFGGDSAVIVVVNKTDEHTLELNEPRLHTDYAPNIRAFHYVSCRTGDGIAALKKTIIDQLNDLPDVHNRLPIPYFHVKSALEQAARESDYLERQAYLDICRKHDLDEAEDQDLLLRFLHQLGSVLNYVDRDSPYDLADTHILNPEWVTQGVYQILNDKLLLEDGGRLALARARSHPRPGPLSRLAAAVHYRHDEQIRVVLFVSRVQWPRSTDS